MDRPKAAVLWRCVLLLTLFSVTPAHAQPPVSLETQLEQTVAALVADGWKSHGSRHGVYVLSHDGQDTRIRTVRALLVMNADADRIRDVIADYESYPEFVPYVAECEVVHREGDSVWVFQQLDFPWPVRNRYFTVRITRTSPERGTFHRFEWTLAQNPTRQKKGHGVALPVTEGSWEITQPGPEPVSLVVYELHADPGGWLPAWAINAGYRRVVPSVVNALRERAREG